MSKSTALIIEDSQTQGEFIGRMLAREDWNYVLCKEIKAARDLLRYEKVQLMLIDIYLAEETSLPHIPALREAAPSTPIAVMSAGTQAEDVTAALNAARGAGADFVLRKPFNPEQIRPILTSARIEQTRGGRRKHALVVDDCRFVRHHTIDVLDKAGYRTSEAKTMEEAFKNIDIAHVDLVVSDIFMPGMGGIEGIKRIKTTWPRVKVIAMSAGLEMRLPTEKALLAAKVVGADGQLPKPFDDSLLTTMAGTLLS